MAWKRSHPDPTYYRLNRRGRLRRLGGRAGFSAFEFRMIEGEPVYLKFRATAFLLGVAYERVVDRLSWLAGCGSTSWAG